MAEAYLRQSALVGLALESRARTDRGEAGVALAERPLPGIVDLRVSAGDEAALAAVERTLGFALPVAANRTAGRDQARALWLGPDQWWIVTPDEAEAADKLRAALEGRHAAITEVGESRACIRISGPKARDLVAKGCPLDLHPRVFGPGHCAQSHLAKAQILLHQVSDGPESDGPESDGPESDGPVSDGAEGPVYDLYVARSFAEYLWLWLEDAAREYGVAVTAVGTRV